MSFGYYFGENYAVEPVLNSPSHRQTDYYNKQNELYFYRKFAILSLMISMANFLCN